MQLLSESDGGSPGVAFAASASATMAPPFRFSRMGPNGANKQLGTPNRKKIGAAMTVGGDGESQIPAGFTNPGPVRRPRISPSTRRR